MTINTLDFESGIRDLIVQGDLDGALAFIRFLVDHVRFDPAATGVTLGSPALDRLCGEIGAATLVQSRQAANATPAKEPVDVIILATELYALGGHSRVIADMIAARPDKHHLVLLSDFFGNADRAAITIPGCAVEFAPANAGRLDKLLWLQTGLARHPAAEVLVFNHHGDAATIAAIQPGLNREVVFCHHADYQLCLGMHLHWTRHVDFFALCQHRCSEAGIAAGYWPLSVPDHGPRSHDEKSFGHGAELLSCTSGVWSKFDEVYPFHYVDVIADILDASGGRHLHIGGIPEDALARIYAELDAKGIARDRFRHVDRVASVWDALLENGVDVYIGSFPLGGGRATTEALGAGIPVITHRHHLEPMLGGCGLGPAETWSWSTPRELAGILARLTPAELARRSGAARAHYLQHHSPDVFGHCLRTGESAPLPPYAPPESDRLASYLLRAVVRKESHEPVMAELGKRIEAVGMTGVPFKAPVATGHAPGTLAQAIALYENGDLEAAGAAFTELHARYPAEPQVFFHLGLIALRAGLVDDAGNFFDHAASCSQDVANTLAAIGQRCLALDETNFAAVYLQAALQRNPALLGARALLADTLDRQGNTRDALALLKPLVQQGEIHPEVLQRVIRFAAAAGDADTELTACLQARAYADCHSRALLLMSRRDDVSATVLFEESRRFVAAHANVPAGKMPAGPRKRLRIGFVLGNIAADANTQRLEHLLCDIDTERFETLLYFDGIHDATAAQRLALVVDESHRFSGMSPDEAAHLVRSRDTDVLVDLGWHAHLPAFMIFSRRAAPVQINFSQSVHSSALANMDFVLCDLPAIDATLFSERILHLDCNTPAHHAQRFGECLLEAWRASGGSVEISS